MIDIWIELFNSNPDLILTRSYSISHFETTNIIIPPWKNPVFLSPSLSRSTLDFCHQLSVSISLLCIASLLPNSLTFLILFFFSLINIRTLFIKKQTPQDTGSILRVQCTTFRYNKHP